MSTNLARTTAAGLVAAATAAALLLAGTATAAPAPASPAVTATPTATPTPPGGLAPARTIWEFRHAVDALGAATSSAAWVDVPGLAVTFAPAAGTAVVLDATFTAESSCVGGRSCSVRIVAVSAAGAATELGPVVGTDFAFDSPGGVPQSHAVRRTSDPLPGGQTYTVKVQAATVGGGTLTLDDSNLGVTMLA